MSSRRQRAERRRQELENPQYGWIWKPLAVLLVLAVMVAVGLGIWWSLAPSRFDVETATQEQRISAAPAARGTVTVATLATLIDTLQDKPGGYLRNDLMPPGLLLDNMPSWETGVLVQARLMAASLADFDPGAGESVNTLIAALEQDADDWLAPSMEDHLAQAGNSARAYLARFDDGVGASFVDQGQGLALYLDAVRQQLASLRERLSSTVSDSERLKELGIEVAQDSRVPWYRVDNVFHETRGQTWALGHLLEALERDQADLIASAGLGDSYARALAEIERMQRQFWSPVVLRGSGLGIFANYPLTMAHHLSRLDGALASLIDGLGGANAAPEAATPPVTEVTRSPDDEEAAESAGVEQSDEKSDEQGGQQGAEANSGEQGAEANSDEQGDEQSAEANSDEQGANQQQPAEQSAE
ncbi:DUF2333 family protein [Halomonas sp. SCS19]|uniref:DUF2333 family protein n=1 Tax=Halomonas sp. SCS19 TaxID=2950870 RepID=UPI0032DF8E78